MSEAAAPAGFSRLFSDDRLTRRAVGGDERAFAAIFRRYHQGLYRFCLAIVGNPEDAQDALQNTMIKVLRALPGEERKIELKPWLYRIAHNESIDLLRRRRETRQLDLEQVAPGYGLAEDAATRERLRRLLTDLRELPERQREVLVMRELAGLRFDEIAAGLETSAAVVRQTLYEARMSLRQMEEGREMDCDEVTKALSDGDGRVIRRRDVRAHLRSCANCRSFRDEIKGRQRDLAAISPLPAVAAAGMLQGLVGGSGAATGGSMATILGGGAAKTIATSVAAKGVATVAVVAAMGVTAADRTGLIQVGLPSKGSAQSSERTPEAAGTKEGAHQDTSASGFAGGVSGGDRAENSPTGKANSAPQHLIPGAGVKEHGAHSKGQSDAEHPISSPNSKEQGPPLDQATDRGNEKHHSATAGGQEATADRKSPSNEVNGGGNKGGSDAKPAKESKPTKESKPAKESKPPRPPHSEPPKGPPANPPEGALPPEVAPQAHQPPGQATETGSPGASGGPGKGAEKKHQAT